jgi:cbb3-type cytochrome c oxidase subunit I
VADAPRHAGRAHHDPDQQVGVRVLQARYTAPHVETDLVHAHGLAALATLLLSVLFGIVVSLQLILPDLGRDVAWLSWGRLRYAHTQGIMLGWLTNAFFAFVYHAVPILTGRPVTSRRLGLWLFALWNFAVMAPGWLLVLAGVSQPIEWAEFPLVVDAVVVVALVLAAVQFLPGFFARGLESLYVSSWYIIGGLVFTMLAFPMGNLVPEIVAGASGAAFTGLWIHDAIGLYVTPLALAIIYFVIPASTRRPVYSHFLSMLGFWLLFFLYPLNGTHHYVFSVIPMPAQVGAIAASALLGVTVVIVVTNLFLSMRGAGWLARDPGLRFVATSTAFYLVVSVQGASQAQMAINQTIHFTDWVIGHSHMAMLGFASFAAAGGLVHAWQRIPWARYNARAIQWAYWLLVVGMVTMFVDLTAAGWLQGRMWQSAAPWIDSVVATRPYWIVRTVSGLILAAGFVSLLLGLTTGPIGAGRREVDTGDDAEPMPQVAPRLTTAAAMEAS